MGYIDIINHLAEISNVALLVVPTAQYILVYYSFVKVQICLYSEKRNSSDEGHYMSIVLYKRNPMFPHHFR